MVQGEQLTRPGRPARLADLLLPALACGFVIVIYAVIACTAGSETASGPAANAYYNRLVDGFLNGHLWLARDAPPGLAALANPYDSDANAAFRGFMYTPDRVHDLSYFNKKLYLYFGVVPAVVLFLPYRLLTGGYVSHQQACAIFSSLGFLASVVLLHALWRRFFPGSARLLWRCVCWASG